MALAKQRARRAEDKAVRRRDIMQAALALLDTRRFPEIKMIDIARQAGLAKGTLFLYFPTKEALFLSILEVELEAWLEDLNRHFDDDGRDWNNTRVARLFVDTLVTRDRLTRLLTLVSSVLEHNVDLARVVAFKSKLVAMLAPTGARIETRLSFLGAGDGVMLLLRVYALVVGVRQLCDPGDIARQALQRPELRSLAIDFEQELGVMCHALLAGLERNANPPPL
ncbi:MAG: TetR family transcriptional regulator [Haliangiales bacterium]